MAIKPIAPKGAKPVNQAKVAAKPTRSLPEGMTVGKPKSVAKAMGSGVKKGGKC